jgi:aldehyde:ferredoxin oxidoreductase
MGAKGLKAIIINPAGGSDHPLRNPADFELSAQRFAEALRNDPVCGQGLGQYGTAVMVNLLHEAGALPTRNFTVGRFDGHEAVSGESLNRITLQRGGEGVVARGCMTGCIMQCSGIFPDQNGKFISKWPEYETICAFGPNLGISDLDIIARCDQICDDAGVDTIDVGGALALLMEAGILPHGDAEAVLKLLEEIGAGTTMGRVLGCGTGVTGKVFGLRRVPVVKGQSLPAYDPRSAKGQGVTYATTPMGADHTAGYAITANILNIGDPVDPLSRQGQVELSRKMQISAATVDSIGLCLFVAFSVLENPEAMNAVVDMLNAKFGLTLPLQEVVNLGKKVLETEMDFNRRAGFTEADNRLPDFFSDEAVLPHAAKFDISAQELDSVLKW